VGLSRVTARIEQRRLIVVAAASLLLLASNAVLAVADTSSVRVPQGVYAHVDFEDVLHDALKQVGFAGSLPPCAALPVAYRDAVHAQLRVIYQDLLTNQAMSGIRAGISWCRVQTEDPTCPPHENPCRYVPDDGNDWGYVDDFFVEASAAGKFVQLVVTPGIYSPAWLINRLPDCTEVLESPSPAMLPPCGRVTFARYPEQRTGPDGPLLLPMPLPWDVDYRNAWNRFLADLATRYTGKNASYPGVLDSIGIATPICASNEMILPSSANGSYVDVTLHGKPARLPADAAWMSLIQNSFSGNPLYAVAPGQIFIDSWNQAIDDSQAMFSGVTLLLSVDDGGNFPSLAIAPDTGDGRVYGALSAKECAGNEIPSCLAKVAVLYHLLYSPTPTGQIVNPKVAEVDGMTARSPATFGGTGIGVQGVKFLAAYTPPSDEPPLPGPIFAGAQFDFSVTKMKQQEGCLTYQANNPADDCNPLSFQQAAFNVFTAFFANTGKTAAALFDASDNGPAYPIQFVNVASSDVQFANEDQRSVLISNGTKMSMEDIFALATYALLYLVPGP
jgi:hypothetical protein